MQQPALDVVPLTEPPVQLEDRGRVTLVILRPAIEDLRAFGRHHRETRLEVLQRAGRLAHLPESGSDLLEPQVQFRHALVFGRADAD